MKVKQMGLLELGMGRPRRVADVEQRAVFQPPEACDKCGCPFLVQDGREVRCPGHLGGCGKTWHLIRPGGPYVKPEAPPERPPEPGRRRGRPPSGPRKWPSEGPSVA
jgi:hypothetical protein